VAAARELLASSWDGARAPLGSAAAPRRVSAARRSLRQTLLEGTQGAALALRKPPRHF